MSTNLRKQNFFRATALTAAVAGMFIFSSAPGPAVAAGDAAKGKAVFDNNCAICHSADTEDALVGPGLKNLMKWPAHKLSDGTEHKEHTADVIKKQVVEGGGSMAPMGDAVKGEDLDNLMAYLESL